MSIQIKPQNRLSDAVPGSRLFKDWLTGDLKADFLVPEHQNAGRELDLALKGGPAAPDNANDPAPLFGSAWVSGWAESSIDLAPPEWHGDAGFDVCPGAIRRSDGFTGPVLKEVDVNLAFPSRDCPGNGSDFRVASHDDTRQELAKALAAL